MKETDSIEVNESANTNAKYNSPQQIIDEIITLSSLPNSRWKNLLVLKLVKVIYLLFIAGQWVSISQRLSKFLVYFICILSWETKIGVRLMNHRLMNGHAKA